MTENSAETQSRCRLGSTGQTFKSRIYRNVGEQSDEIQLSRTITVLPLVYAILSLLELILVDSPRVVAGLQGNKSAFLKDIAGCKQVANEGCFRGGLGWRTVWYSTVS